MKHIVYITFFLLLFFTSQFVKAEDFIKILMLENPDNPMPSKQAESLGKLNGKVFINGQFYVGYFEVKRDENGLYIINDLPFERYIEGVVASETGKEWEIEALKAQAVISRTYAIFYKTLKTKKDFHLTSSVLHQVYKGNNTSPLIRRAVKETEGEILIYEGYPIKAFYHSTCVGKTELPEEVWGGDYPYLKSVDCNSKNSPYENWQRRFSFEKIEKALGISSIEDISIASYTSTGRVKTLNIVAANTSEMEVKATDLRKLLGYRELPSTHFSLIIKESGYAIFDGKGYGHGVGLSQWGALEMAKQGKNYKEILKHYYPGTILKTP